MSHFQTDICFADVVFKALRYNSQYNDESTGDKISTKSQRHVYKDPNADCGS
jgi:hypothetical protein